MATPLLTCLLATLLVVHSEARAVNISNTWILPQEGFPVFYRYFRDRISWYEADAVCQFHHANLVTVDTTSQYDAARAYLKELDIMSNVWIGLIKSNEEGDFSWTDYKPLSGEGYWGDAPGDGRAPLCAALDPSHDFRWTALSCGGPQVASFICELPVPTWALSETGGCLVRSLPSLTVQYLPELAAVRLASDCGLDGTKSVTCKANEEHKDILKELSCFVAEDDFSDNAVTSDMDSGISSGSSSRHTGSWSVTPTTTTAGDFFSSTRLRRETPETSTPLSFVTTIATGGSTVEPKKATEPITTETHANLQTSTEFNIKTVAPLKKIEISHVSESPAKAVFTEQPKSERVSSTTTTEKSIETKKVKKEQSITNKKENKKEQTSIAEESPKHVDIFTQSSDHFIPPLVMAKSKLSTDMTLVSAESKHHKQNTHQNTHKNIQQTETTITPVVHLKPTIVDAPDVVPEILPEKVTDSPATTTDSPPSTTTKSIPKDIPATATVLLQTTKHTENSDDLLVIKYKKPTKGKKYDKTKEKKKFRETLTTVQPTSTERIDKVVQITIDGLSSSSAQPQILDVTTRLPEPKQNEFTTASPTTTKIKQTTESVIDPNIMKLNNARPINNESEPVIKSTTIVAPTTIITKILTKENKPEKPIEEATTQLLTTERQQEVVGHVETTEIVTEHSPEPLPRPNRSRLLTQPTQHRSFYPYFFNRVWG